MLFLIGFVELFIATLAVQMIQKERTIFAGVVTLVSVLIWCYLVRVINAGDTFQIIIYALGCTAGTMVKIKLTKLQHGVWKKVP